MAKKSKFYVVWKGRKTGIFDSWDECKESISTFEGAQYKGYATEEEARQAHAMNYWKAVNAGKSGNNPATNPNCKPILPSISVDAACSGNPGTMEYRGVNTADGKEIFRMGPYQQATNNVGEFLALVHGIAYLVQNNLDIPIYSDSISAIAWVRKKECKSKLAPSFANTEVFNLIARAEKWLQTHTFNNPIIKWPTEEWGEIPADFGRK